MKIRCVIVDDEQLARQLLNSYVDKLPQLEVVAQCKNAMEVLEVIQNEHIDLLFLDIQMPDLTGLDLVKTMRNPPAIIFTTAYKEHALEGFELNAVDYMLKPVSFDRFVKGVNKAIELLELRNGHTVDEPKEIEKPTPQPEFITLKADHRIYKVKLDDILYIEGLREYVSFFTTKQKIITLESLKRLEEVLPSHFLRVHKSYIVNRNKVESLYGNQLEIDGKHIPIGKSYKEEVVKKVF